MSSPNNFLLQSNYTYKPIHFGLLMGLFAFILLARLGAAPIYILDEAKNAQCAREMLQRSDWVVPTFNGELRTDKPVLHYYFMMVAYKIFGVNEFAARFFSAILGLLTVWVTFVFARRFTNVVTALFSAMVLVASTQFLFEFRLSVPDPYLIFFVTTGLLTAYSYLQQNKFIYLVMAAICFSLATLAKGPVALALPGLCLLIWVVYKKLWQRIFTFKILIALALIALITLPWYIAVHNATNGAWTQGFFIDHNLNRFSDPQEGHGGFFLLTLVFVVVGLLPFTSFLGEVLKNRKAVFEEDFVKFSGLVVLAFVVFFSLASTKLPNYPMPCYPFVAIVFGNYLSKVITGTINIKKYPLYILLGILLILPFAGYLAIKQETEAQYVSWVALLLLAGPICFIYILAYWKTWPTFKKITAILLGWSVFNIMALHTVYPLLYSQNPVQKTLPVVKKYPTIFTYEIYNPGYNFYLNTSIKRFYSVDSLKEAMRKNPSALIITRTDFSETLKPLNLIPLAQHHDLFESPTTILYVTRPQP